MPDFESGLWRLRRRYGICCQLLRSVLAVAVLAEDAEQQNRGVQNTVWSSSTSLS